MPQKTYVIIQNLNKELVKHKNFIGYIDGRLNAMDGDLLVMKTRFEKTKKEYNDNTKDLQNARTDTLNKIKNLEAKLKKVGIPPPPEEPRKSEIEVIAEDIAEHQEHTITEVKKVINDEFEKIIVEGKTQCPECKNYYTKGGAFISHYKACINHKNGD